MPGQLPQDLFSAWAGVTLRAWASLCSLASGLSTASSQYRKALPSVSQRVPALTSIRYYNSRIDQEVIIGNACFICIPIFYMHKCISNFNQGGEINDSESIKMQNHAIIKMNSACRDYISLSQMWDIFEWYMIFCNFF